MGRPERAAAALCAFALALMALWAAVFSASRRPLPQTAYPSPAPSAPAEAAEPAGDRLDLNAATMDELVALPGIGEARARAILELRSKKGGFRRAEELLEVPGIGEATLEALLDHITVGG